MLRKVQKKIQKKSKTIDKKLESLATNGEQQTQFINTVIAANLDIIQSIQEMVNVLKKEPNAENLKIVTNALKILCEAQITFRLISNAEDKLK